MVKSRKNAGGDGMGSRREHFSPLLYILFALAAAGVFVLCICLGSVSVPLDELFSSSIVRNVRLPRVLCAALTGASLSLCGAAMQGLLKNPLADGSTLGVTSGASLGAVLAMAFGVTVPGLPFLGTTVTAMLFSFLSLLLILGLAYRLDHALSTNTIILIGVIFSMFASSINSLMVTFAGDKVRNIMFWTMGSLSGKSYTDVLILLVALLAGAPVLLCLGRELNAFSIGEDNARSVGVNVRRVKLTVLIAVSALIGVCVSVGGTIGFVGLVIPHMTRMLTGPNHRRLLPACLFFGAIFLMLTDLLSRTILSPLELPIGVVTSLIGSVTFVYIFWRTRRGK